ncbi:MAG: alcohol dehydrogenase catalytic domain-containing protein [Actinomycetota bacterium]
MAVTGYGDPLQKIEVSEPVMSPGHALLEVLACGVCFSDVKTSRGLMPFSGDLAIPHIPGHEIFGRVLATDPPGLVEEGTRAVVYHYWPCGSCSACRRGDETLCRQMVGWAGFTHWGGFTERISVPVDRLVSIPDGIDPVHAAPMSCALGTAYRSVVTRGGVGAGMKAAVVGLGGVGIHAAQVGRASGAAMIGFDVHEPTLESARGLDLDVRRADDEDGIEQLLRATDREGVDVVIDTVGHDDTLALARRLVRPGGRVVGVGYAPDSALTVPTPRFVLDEVEYVGSRYAHRDDLAKAVSLVERGLVSMVVGMVRPLEEVNEVFQALESGSVVGRAVLEVAPGGSLQGTD